MSLKKCRSVLFDWDGTLIDSMPIKIENAGKVLNEMFGCDPEMVKESYRRHSGFSRFRLFEAITRDVLSISLDKKTFESISCKFSEKNFDSIDNTVIFPDVRPGLKELNYRGLFLGVSSSVPQRDLSDIVMKSGLREQFRFVMGSKDGFGKGPDHTAFACKELGITPRKICMVGDDAADIRLAREAGIFAVSRVGTLTREALEKFQPDKIIHDISELVEMFNENESIGSN